MIILAFDGTAKCASCAVLRDDVCLGEYNIDNGLTQSELLVPMAESLMKSLKMNFSDVELYATSVGPGSFTGVRIGAALVKGLAFGRNIPCASVSTLDALAENARGISGIIVPAMDARRGQVYCNVTNGDTIIAEDDCRMADDLEQFILATDKDVYFVGDGKDVCYNKFEKYENVKKHSVVMPCTAFGACLLAENMPHQTHFELSPSYLRLSQAERELKEKNK